MRKYLVLLLGLALCLYTRADNKRIVGLLSAHAEFNTISDKTECDTVIDYDGYAVRIIKDNGNVRHIGLNLFSDTIRKTIDKGLLNYIEEALLARSLKINDKPYDKLVISKGKISDFKSLTPESYYTVNFSNSMTVEWTKNSKKVSVTVPGGYDTSSLGSRSEIENDFISRLRSSDGRRPEFEALNMELLEPYKNDKYIYLGGTYLSKDVTRNTYFEAEDLSPVWDTDFPLQSIANMIIYPSDRYGDNTIDLKILKHEYGESESLSISVNQLLSVCENDGCIPFWGIENYENGILKGAIFLYNYQRGYDHVIRIECNPEDVIDRKGKLKAVASLFIPTNNVDDLFAPYVSKTDKEKIKYDR